MAGYDGFSMSNNALAARNEGRYPASVVADRVAKFRRFRGCTAADVRAVLSASEWHHTSARYNRTSFYDLRDLASLDTRQELAQRIADRKEYAKLRAALPESQLAYFPANPLGGDFSRSVALIRSWESR